MMSNTILIGNPPQSKITAFGDDSNFNKTNSSAFVLFKNSKLELARGSLHNLKQQCRIPDTVPLHMRLLGNEFYKKEKGYHI